MVQLNRSGLDFWKMGIPTLSPNATRLERGCVPSTSRSTLKGSAALGIKQQAGFANLLRLVFDTAALRGSVKMRRNPC